MRLIRPSWWWSGCLHRLAPVVAAVKSLNSFTISVIAVVTLLLPLHAPSDAARPSHALPQGIPQAQRVKLDQVITNAVVSTRMEVEPYVTRPDIFGYLLDHPEFATHITQTLKLARYRIWRTQDGLFLDDGWGAKGYFAVVHAEPGARVMYARGHFEHPLLPNIHGRAVVVIEYDFRRTAEGRTAVATAVTGYVALDSRFLGLAGKLAGPLAQGKADLEARRLLKVFARVSRAIEERPDEVYEQLQQRSDVPRQELEEFHQLLRNR